MTAVRVWIDTDSGTWGDASTGSLVVVDLDRDDVRDPESGELVDGATLVAFLDNASDAEISDLGRTYGRTVS